MSRDKNISSSPPIGGQSHPTSAIDRLLSTQILVAWAGETADQPRQLGWWRSDLTSEFGGRDLFRRLMPQTWEWAVLQAVREAARQVDRAVRARHHNPDSIRSLFHLGFEVDELLDERLLDLKRSGRAPSEALPALALTSEGWSRERFEAWIGEHGEVPTTTEPIGRRIRLSADNLGELTRLLVAALLPLAESYPLPYISTNR